MALDPNHERCAQLRGPIVVIDNYDSFTYNLVQYLGVLGARVRVFRNDALTLEELAAERPLGVVLSPGPGRPEDAGLTPLVIRQCGAEWPVLGVCLGHQALGQAFGGQVVRAGCIMHGKTDSVFHDGAGVFQGLPSPLTVTRYHSLVVDPSQLNGDMCVSARTADGTVMGLRHRTLPLEGVQFHPESFMTEQGLKLMANWLAFAREWWAARGEPVLPLEVPPQHRAVSDDRSPAGEYLPSLNPASTHAHAPVKGQP